MNRALGKTLLALLLAATAAGGQQSRYSVPGSLAEPRADLFEAMMQLRDTARWRVGFLDLEPQLAISDLGYVSNIYNSGADESQSDLRATGVAGLRGFFNLGPKVLVSPFANLSRAWWQDQEELRSTNGSFGIQLFGNFNRLRFDVQAAQLEVQRNLSSELEVPVDLRNDRVEFGLDIDFWGPLRLFAGGSVGEKRFSGAAAETNVPGLDLILLDADTKSLHAGLGYVLRGGLEIGVGVQRAETSYLSDADGRSNEGTGPMVRASFESPRLVFEVEAAWRDLEFPERTASAAIEEVTGLGRVELRLTQLLSAGVYGGSQLQASALDSTSLFESRRTGLFMQRSRRDRTTIRLFYESGQDDFTPVTLQESGRRDDFETWGINVNFDLTPRIDVSLGFFDSRRDSTDPVFDRDFSSLQTAIRLGGNLLPW